MVHQTSERKGAHVEVEVVGHLPVSDTSIRPKLKCTVPGIRGRSQWCPAKG